MSNITTPERVTVTIPDEIKDMFTWLKKYDPAFEGKDASIGAFLLKLGAEAYYKQGLENIEPLESEFTAALTDLSVEGIFQTLDEPVLMKAK